MIYSIYTATFENGKKSQKKHNSYKFLLDYYEKNPEKRSEIMKEWYSRPENKNIARERRINAIKKYGNKAGKPKIKINLQNKKTKEILKFSSLSEAAKSIGCSASALTALRKSKLKSVKNYILLKD